MKTKLTKAAVKRHIKTHGYDIYLHGCLYCGAGHAHDLGTALEYGKIPPDIGGDILQQVTCPKCKRKWIDVFRLVEVREIV